MLYMILYFYCLVSTLCGKGISSGWVLPCTLNPLSKFSITHLSAYHMPHFSL